MNEEEKILHQIIQENDIFNKARLIFYLIKERGWRIKDLSRKLNLKPSYLCHILRLNRLPSLIIDGYYNQQITMSHLFVISRLKEEKEMIKLYEDILAKNFTVSQTEDRLREIIYQVKNFGEYFPKEKIKILEEKIKKIFPKAKIRLVQTRVKTKLLFELKDNLKNTTRFIKEITDKLS